MTPGEPGDLGEAYCVGGGDSCSEGGRCGRDGGGGSSSEWSGVSCGCRDGRTGFAAESVERDLPCMIPAIAAAGPAGVAFANLCSGSGSGSVSGSDSISREGSCVALVRPSGCSSTSPLISM